MKTLTSILICLAAVLVSHAAADDVILGVQTKLKRLGYYNGVVDGQMGSQTAAAIRRFQIAQKLKVTGELNPQTLRRLNVPAPKARSPRKDFCRAGGIRQLGHAFQRWSVHFGRA